MKMIKSRFVVLFRLIILLMPLLFLFAFSMEIAAQEPPPRPVVITVYQNLGFGAFSHGLSGGSVIISPTGSRSSTGDVILLTLGYSFSAAQYRLVANPGTVISITYGNDVNLIGSNGGFMVLHMGTSDPVYPFVISTTPPNYTLLNIGATLTVSNATANPPGAYSGTFYITLIQE
jgi:hypothetical protein